MDTMTWVALFCVLAIGVVSGAMSLLTPRKWRLAMAGGIVLLVLLTAFLCAASQPVHSRAQLVLEWVLGVAA